MTVQQAFEIAMQHHHAGRLADAEILYRQVLATDPRHANALHLMGGIAHQVGRNHDAVKLFREAIAIKPMFPEAFSNLGLALHELGELDQSIAACRQAIELNSDYAAAHYNLGNAQYGKRQLHDAIASFRRAIVLKPNYPEAYGNLGCALFENDQLDEAIAAQQTAIALKPNYPEAHGNLGIALQVKGYLDEALAAYRQAITLKPDLPETHSNLLYVLHLQPGFTALAIAEEHRRWNQQHADPLRQFIRPHANDRDPGRRLRIGYVSPDFREHSVAYLVENVFANHDPGAVEVFCYSNLRNPDSVTSRLRRLAHHWREIFGVPDEEVAALIRKDQIDVLVDLAGHTANYRLLVFARKAAPVQVTWLGYPDTTGLSTMDYRITDSFADPLGTTEPLHSERLVRLPECAWCYRPCEDAPPASVPPVIHAGHITFGSFNTQAKVSMPLLRLWSEILRAVPGSRLFLKNRSLQDAATRARILKALADSGIALGRVDLEGYAATLGDHLASYGRVDIALDTFPYHGTITTCEALWMGVPVVSLAGKTHASRVGVSLLNNVGLPELVAASEEQYMRIAVSLAGDVPRLEGMRCILRERMRASPLMDAPRFARNLEQAYRQMWQTWCAKENSISLK